jgi:hypothetical protein
MLSGFERLAILTVEGTTNGYSREVGEQEGLFNPIECSLNNQRDGSYKERLDDLGYQQY